MIKEAIESPRVIVTFQLVRAFLRPELRRNLADGRVRLSHSKDLRNRLLPTPTVDRVAPGSLRPSLQLQILAKHPRGIPSQRLGILLGTPKARQHCWIRGQALGNRWIRPRRWRGSSGATVMPPGVANGATPRAVAVRPALRSARDPPAIRQRVGPRELLHLCIHWPILGVEPDQENRRIAHLWRAKQLQLPKILGRQAPLLGTEKVRAVEFCCSGCDASLRGRSETPWRAFWYDRPARAAASMRLRSRVFVNVAQFGVGTGRLRRAELAIGLTPVLV